jgi:ubiquitin C-terminal hydrolase
MKINKKIKSEPEFIIELSEGSESEELDLEIPKIGIKNKGSHCYLNALIQIMFHVSDIRELIF